MADNPATRPRPVFYALIFAAVAIVYSKAVYAPFVFDDDLYVSNNLWIRSLGNFTDLSSMRYVADLSFALNYSLTGDSAAWFHLTNILIHLANAYLVMYLASLILRAPLFYPRGRARGGISEGSIAFFTALLFAVHPLQTQAVTYITQRYTSLAALFYLLALVFFLKSRFLSLKKTADAPGGRGRAYYAASIICTIVAMKTKEIAFTIPFAVMLFEYTLFWRDGGSRLKCFAPYLATLIIIPVNLFLIHPAGGGNAADALMKARKIEDLSTISRYGYLITEPRVLLRYLRLLFIPSGQQFAYYRPLSKSLFEPGTFASVFSVLALLAGSCYSLARSVRRGEAIMAYISLGVIWFFLTVSVESSVVPIADVISEHRAYLPSIGIIFASVCALSAAPRYLFDRLSVRVNERSFILAAIIAAISLLGAATYRRNALWADKFSMYSYEAAKNPDKVSPHLNLGGAYFESRMFPQAIREFKAAVDINPAKLIARIDLADTYMAAGMDAEAITQYRAIAGINPQNLQARFNLAVLYLKKGLYKDAEHELEKISELSPGNGGARGALELLRSGKAKKIVVD